ncbi:CNT_collapsed_G0006870.mRNA.1.CDS.1 [Saccharomyces cerevisiae]|nr:CNT_collapsed_G0006870.mRNA.1.CDS.1 [Saccharomyces cerevisiae]
MGSEEDKKLTKKQLKAQQFRKVRRKRSRERRKEQAPEGKDPTVQPEMMVKNPVKKRKHVEAVVVRAKW